MDSDPSTSRPLVLVTRALPDGWLDGLSSCELLVGPADRAGWTDPLLAALPRADAIFCLLTEPVDEAILERAPRLKVVSNMAVGVDNVDVAACTRRRIPVGHTPGVLTEATADLTFALLLARARRLPEATTDAREGRWSIWSPDGWLGADLAGATLGIVGMGKIGRAVCRRALGFGLRVVYSHPRPVPGLPGDPVHVTLPALLECSDFVSLHVPLRPQTRGLIDADALARMKPTAILINTARGPIVKTDALLAALEAGRLAGAALDVTDPEPLPADHPLYRHPGVIVAPHIGSATAGTRRRMAALACDNLVAGLQGRPLPHCVNPETQSVRPADPASSSSGERTRRSR
jgi:glyoxylate reductase